MRLTTKYAIAALALFVSGCATTSVSECSWAKLIRPTSGDVEVISEDLAEQLLSHNLKYEEFCK